VSDENEKAQRPRKTRPLRAPKKEPPAETALEGTTNAILHMFDRAVHLLEATLTAGKVNPAQGLFGMIMISDLLHGGAYVGPAADRPALGGKASKYYQDISITKPDLYPLTGFNILDPLGSFFNIIGEATTTVYAQSIVTEIYLNANVPHKFPKLLSDEAYARIQIMAAYLSHSAYVKENANGIKTLVEASAIPVETLSKAAQRVMPSGEQLKELKALLGPAFVAE
jgi:hypothetical protein